MKATKENNTLHIKRSTLTIADFPLENNGGKKTMKNYLSRAER